MSEKEEWERLRAEHLVETDWLAAHLDDPALRIVDMRGAVRTETDATGYQQAEYLRRRADYEASHIPGAAYLDWTSDIVDPGDPVPAQAATAAQLERVLGERGIGDQHQIVAYDDHPASQFATRLWWLLRLYGHDNCRVLNGGWKRWIAEGNLVTTEIASRPKATFTARLTPEWRRTAEEVAAHLRDPTITLLDARDEGQYSGRIRRGMRGGRIPGAVSIPRERLVQDDHTFAPPDQLRSAVESAGVTPDREVIAYCNGGVAATSVLFALSMLGYSHLSNYDGSWNEWNRREELPVESDL